jgi:transcriptional regulator with XRE-family HTH domain
VNAPDYAVNLHRLLAWHRLSQKDVAALLGAREHTVSGWVNGQREPSGRYLRKLGDLFEVPSNKLFSDPDVFGESIADPQRRERADENIARARRERLKVV